MQWKFWQARPTQSDLHQESSLLKRIATGFGGLVGLYLLASLVLMWFWDEEPEFIEVVEKAAEHAAARDNNLVVGYTTTYTLIAITETLFNKRGGYLSNDQFPPGVWMDNIPEWEYGVILQVRDMARAMRIDFSRSQSQSAEDPDIAGAEGKLFFDHNSWILPQTEDEYGVGIASIERYLARLANADETNAQFYARADNIQQWLQGVETRLGGLSQQLSASVGKRQLNTDLAGDPDATQATQAPMEQEVKTQWSQIDNVIYHARGQTWALLHLLRAMEHDFRDVLDKKNARVSLQQIIRELEPTLDPIEAPVTLNGNGFGLFANHSLVMASYIARANAAITDLRTLLTQG